MPTASSLVVAMSVEELRSFSQILVDISLELSHCETPKNSNFLKKGKIVISVKIQNFSRSRMMKRISSLESSREI